MILASREKQEFVWATVAFLSHFQLLFQSGVHLASAGSQSIYLLPVFAGSLTGGGGSAGRRAELILSRSFALCAELAVVMLQQDCVTFQRDETLPNCCRTHSCEPASSRRRDLISSSPFLIKDGWNLVRQETCSLKKATWFISHTLKPHW